MLSNSSSKAALTVALSFCAGFAFYGQIKNDDLQEGKTRGLTSESLNPLPQPDNSQFHETVYIKEVTKQQADQQQQDEKKEKKISSIVRDIEASVENIKSLCGDICDTESFIKQPRIKREVQCRHIFKHQDVFDATHHQDLKYPIQLRHLTPKLLSYFTLDGRVRASVNYFDEMKHKSDTDGESDTDHIVWANTSMIERQVAKTKDLTKKGIIPGNYPVTDRTQLFEGMKMLKPEGKRILVIGSITPWVEILLLSLDAATVDTLEYAEIVSEHKQLNPYTPERFRKSFLSDELEPYDAVVSFSAIEHSGLGRYGDGINPWGDLLTMAKIWCVLKDNGHVLVGFPINEQDKLIFNAHRLYGPKRIPLMFEHYSIQWASYGEDIRHINRTTVFHQGVILAQKA